MDSFMSVSFGKTGASVLCDPSSTSSTLELFLFFLVDFLLALLGALLSLSPSSDFEFFVPLSFAAPFF